MDFADLSDSRPIADATAIQTADGGEMGLILFGTDTLITSLEFYEMDGWPITRCQVSTAYATGDRQRDEGKARPARFVEHHQRSSFERVTPSPRP